MLFNNVYLEATGRWLPPQHAATDAITAGQIDPALATSADLAGVTAAVDIAAAQMAGRAALDALQHTHYTAQDLGALLFAAFAPAEPHYAPWSHVQRIVGADQALAMQISAASNSAMAAMHTAAALLPTLANPGLALIATAARFPPNTWPRWKPIGGIFGADGAAAAILSRSPGIARILAITHTSRPDLEELCRTNPNGYVATTVNEAAPLLRNTGLTDYLDELRAATQQVIHQLLTEIGLSLNSFDHIVVPGLSPPFLETVLTGPLGLNVAQTTWPFHRHTGHVGPCDQLLAIDHLLRHHRLRPNQQVLMISLGIGFTWSCIAIQIAKHPHRQHR